MSVTKIKTCSAWDLGGPEAREKAWRRGPAPGKANQGGKYPCGLWGTCQAKSLL